MRYIVAGGRDFNDADRLNTVLTRFVEGHDLQTIISGCAKGADTLGMRFATRYCDGLVIGLDEYPADWATYNKAAGRIRNQQMAQEADGLIAFWNGRSRGTKHMIECATRCNLEIHIYRY